MAFKGITVNTAPEAAAHIYAQDDAAIFQSIFGSDGVFNLGNKFNATVQSNNSVRVSDGVVCVGGHIGRTEYGTYNDLTIENGASGYKRNDIIYARFLTSGSTDTLILAVKKGTQTTGTPADPALTQGNLYQGATTREYPLWRVKLEGLSIVKVEQMFTVIPTIPELEAKYNDLNTDLGDVKSDLKFKKVSFTPLSGVSNSGTYITTNGKNLASIRISPYFESSIYQNGSINGSARTFLGYVTGNPFNLKQCSGTFPNFSSPIYTLGSGVVLVTGYVSTSGAGLHVGAQGSSMGMVFDGNNTYFYISMDKIAGVAEYRGVYSFLFMNTD